VQLAVTGNPVVQKERKDVMRHIISTALLALLCTILAQPAEANPLNRWAISCGADAAAIKRKGKTWTFTESKNHCDGGLFAQRAEISTDPVPLSHKGAYLFKATISMTTNASNRFSLWQVHDSRLGCGPPFQVYVEPSGSLVVGSDIKTGPGESCIRRTIGNEPTKGRISRDGTRHKLQVLIEFDGEGSFNATLWLDEEVQIQGRYQAQSDKYRSEHFYFKHGVYSQHMFDYELISEDVSVTKVKVKN